MQPVTSGPSSSRLRDCRGFSLAEGIAALILFAALMAALTYGTSSLFKFQARPEVAYSGNTYTLAPSFTDFNSAVNLHAAFSVAVDQSDNIIVLGGARSNPVSDPNGPSAVLDSSFSASTLSAAAGSDPFQAFSSWEQKSLNSAQFASYFSTSQDPADFTILTVQGLSRITSITQQRRHTATINGENMVLYEVTYQGIDWSSGSGVAGSAYSYRIYYDAAEDIWAQAPGVQHYWYRTDSSWDRDQEGPSRVVFADPYVLAGQDAQSQVTQVSRFIYFLPQSR